MPTITFRPSDLKLQAPSDQTLLQSARQQGYYFPWGCDAGTCRLCLGRLLKGEIRLKHQSVSLTPASPLANAILCCQAYPITDIEMEVTGVLAPGQFPEQTIAARVVAVEQVNSDVQIVRFLLPAGKKIRFSAGQYLELLIDDETKAAFSIASAPRDDRSLELHIRANPTSNSYPKLAPRLKEGELIDMRLAMGDITLHKLQHAERIVLLMGSTGFSQAKALLEALLAAGDTRPLSLYWGGRVAEDIYLHEQMEQLAQQHPNLHYVPVVSDQPDWAGRKGFVHKAVLEDLQDFSGVIVVGGGSPGMVYAALDDFVAAGMKPEQMISDVFAYAPR